MKLAKRYFGNVYLWANKSCILLFWTAIREICTFISDKITDFNLFISYFVLILFKVKDFMFHCKHSKQESLDVFFSDLLFTVHLNYWNSWSNIAYFSVLTSCFY